MKNNFWQDFYYNNYNFFKSLHANIYLKYTDGHIPLAVCISLPQSNHNLKGK